MVKLDLSKFELGANPIHETASGAVALPSTSLELVRNPSLQVLPIPRGDFIPPIVPCCVSPRPTSRAGLILLGHYRSLCKPRWPKGLVMVVGREK